MARVKKSISEAVEAVTTGTEVQLREHEKPVEVHICRLRDIPAFLELVAKLFTDLEVPLGDKGGIEAVVAAKLNDGPFVLKLISKHMNDVLKVLASLTSLSFEEIEELGPDDAILLAKTAGSVNYSFFMERVLPLIPGVLGENVETKK